MHQSCTIPKLVSPVSGLLGRDTFGFHYGAHMELLNGSHEMGELMIKLNQDMPIVGTSLSEKQVDTSVAGALHCSESGVAGSISLKRERSHEDLEEAWADKRVKVESDDVRPLVEGAEMSMGAPNDAADLTGLLNDLDDDDDSDLDDSEFDEDEVGVGSDLWPAAEFNEWPAASFENGGKAHTPKFDTTAIASDVSSQQAQEGHDKAQADMSRVETVLDTGPASTEVQAQKPQVESMNTLALDVKLEQAQTNVQAPATIGKEKPSPEIVILDSDSDDDDDLIMLGPPVETPQVKLEPPSENSQLANVVKVEQGGMRQVLYRRESQGVEALTVQRMLRAGQEQPGVILQTQLQDGKLMWALIPQNTNATPPAPPMLGAGDHLHLRPAQVSDLPNGLPFGLGCGFGFTPKNEQASYALGEQVGPSHGWISPISSAAVLPYTGHSQPSHMGNGNQAIVHQNIPSPQVPPASRTSQTVGTVQEATTSGEIAGPSRTWIPPSTSAIVPYQYDTTVATPRVEVAHVLQQYLQFINEAKAHQQSELLAQRESTSDKLVREGARRGLECRPDIVAYNAVKKANAIVNLGVRVGDLPGVEVGDAFSYRHQMAVVGLHRMPNVGIDYACVDGIHTATAIVLMPKAGYDDDMDNGIRIVYTGQGGRKKRNQGAPFVCNQVLKRGNLALAKNFERKLPVRVIRGHMGSNHGPGNVLGYTYDGLYMISSYELATGLSGFDVYRYTMERLEDQPPIPPCIEGCMSHGWNTARKAMRAVPLQAKDPTQLEPQDVKPAICIPPLPQVDMDPPPHVPEMKRICI